MSWLSDGKTALENEGYADPAALMGHVLERAATTPWIVLPYEPGHYLTYRGEVVTVVPGSLSGERASWAHVEQGPYLRIPAEWVEAVELAAGREALRPLEERVKAAHAVLDGWVSR